MFRLSAKMLLLSVIRKDWTLIREYSSMVTGKLCKHVFRSTSTVASSLPNYKIIFIGSDNFSLPTLVALTELLKAENVSVVVANVNNIVSRWAEKNRNKVYLWNDFKRSEFAEELKKKGEVYDIGVVASFGYLIPARVINRFPLGILNVHASLLPRWRGASPINHSIIYGDTETGVSIMKIAPHRFDVGPVLLRKAVPLNDHIRAPDLLKVLAKLGAAALIEALHDLPRFINNPIQQDDSLATLAPKLSHEMAEVDWSSKTAIEVYRMFRGLYGSLKLRTTFNERRIDLDELELPVIVNNLESSCNTESVISVRELPPEGMPGQLASIRDKILVRCATSSGLPTWIQINRLKVGIKWMKAKDFKNGFLSKGKIGHGTPRFYLSKSIVEDKYLMRQQ